MTDVFVILPVHNRRGMTMRFLDSLAAQSIWTEAGAPDVMRLEVVLVDDGSADGTGEAVRSWAESTGIALTTVTGAGDWWWAGAVAAGLRAIAGRLGQDDWVYLGNNDTILDPDHLAVLLSTARAHPRALVGARSFEIWSDGHRHPVSAGFRIDAATLEVTNIPGDLEGVVEVEALAGRGVLVPAAAARQARLHPRAMPQHFADIAMTSDLRRRGFRLLVDHRASSDQLERAGSSVEIKPRAGDFLSRRSALYLPAVAAFWWQQSSGAQRVTLPGRLVARGVRQARSGSYALR